MFPPLPVNVVWDHSEPIDWRRKVSSHTLDLCIVRPEHVETSSTNVRGQSLLLLMAPSLFDGSLGVTEFHVEEYVAVTCPRPSASGVHCW